MEKATMQRRDFFQRTGMVTIASLPLFAGARCLGGRSDGASPSTNAADTSTVWHFHDLWRFDRFDGLRLRQGEPSWQADAVYTEPHIGALSAWPTVYRDAGSGRWRMLYSANWKPYQLMIAESDDGRHWRPLAQPSIGPDSKRAAHHLFTLPGGSGGGVYLDPLATDGFPFKVFVHQRGEEVLRRALDDPSHRWHEIAKAEGAKRYLVEDFTLVSPDGLHWQARRDMRWSQPDWHPEPPIFGFYNRQRGQHSITVRPGWGDRRQSIQSTEDFISWSGPELVLQPDALDEELIELYGMPVFPYGDGYVGLLWVFHCESSQLTRGFNRFVGPLDCQLAFSRDGSRFTRSFRRPFIGCNDPGEPGGGAIQPSCLVEDDDEIRIYSAATRLPHGRGSEAKRDGIADNASILLHTIRKDGLMFVESLGDWGHLISKPLTLLEASLTINANAAHGEIQFQLSDLESRPVEGFTFDQCVPIKGKDSVGFPLRWKAAQLEDVQGRIVRLEARIRHAQLFAIRGAMHFIDAQDRWMIEDDKPIATT
jgi:hypothetical protein